VRWNGLGRGYGISHVSGHGCQNTHPYDRAKSIGIFRLRRDLGYAIGAILTGAIADFFNLEASIIAIGALTIFSAIVIQIRMKCFP
jgi:hypothetical protein